MNRAERLTLLLELMASDGRIDVEDVMARFGVSAATARRDLDTLAEQQLLTRTRGGAIAHSVAYSLPVRYMNLRHSQQKARIAQAASAMVPVGASIGLCGGTTSTAIAAALLARADLMEPGTELNLTVVTNAINIAMQFALRPQIKTVMTGGVVQPGSYGLVGSYSAAVLDAIALDFAFIGCGGLDAAHGPTCHDEREAMVNAQLAKRASQVVLVADSSKLGTRVFASLGDSSLFPVVITDAGATPEQIAPLEAVGYQVRIAAE